MSKEQIKVGIQVVAGTITCAPKGGNVHPKIKGAEIQFASTGEAFTLEFSELDSGNKFWPFTTAEPSWPVTSFTGTLKDLAGTSGRYVKYKISVGGKVLDPIIIVDN